MKNLFGYLCVAICVLTGAVFAETNQGTSAIARYGQPKYAPDFSHFSYVNPNAPKGGTLRLGTVGTFDSLNMYAVKGIKAAGVSLLFDSLMKRTSDEVFSLYGCLAERIKVAPDFSKVTFYLNPKARFQDGSPVTAQDVQFTFNLLLKKSYPRYRRHFAPIKQIKVPDAQTVIFHLKKLEGETEHNPGLPLIFASVRILSKKQLETVSFEKLSLKPLMGAGPYTVGKVKTGHFITLVRNPNYWGKDLPINKGNYNFDKIIIHYYKNASAQFQAFRAGEFDAFYEVDPKQWKTGYDMPAVRDGRIKKVAFEHQRPVPVRMMIFNMRRPIFQDIRLRKALTYAFDFETLNRMLFHGQTKRMESLFANTDFAHQGPPKGKELKILKAFQGSIPDSVFQAAYKAPTTDGTGDQRENLKIADQLLRAAGWAVQKGKRVNAQGKHLRIQLMLKDPNLQKIALAFQRNLKSLGIQLDIPMLDATQYETRVIQFDYDMIVHVWSNGRSPGNEQPYYFSAQAANTEGSSNYIGITSPAIEALARKVPTAKSLGELEARVRALDRVVNHNYFWVPLGYKNKLCFAYWQDRIAFPKLDPTVAPNLLEYGWSKTV